jgi:bacillosamine biosynthesis N-acetyltransferase PglD-like protein
MAPRPLLLVGGGGLAREVLAAVRLLPNEWTPIGALDDDPSRHGADLNGVPVLGGSELIGELKDAAVVACVANARRPEGRLTAVRRLDLPDDRWASFRASGQRLGARHSVTGRRCRHHPVADWSACRCNAARADHP